MAESSAAAMVSAKPPIRRRVQWAALAVLLAACTSSPSIGEYSEEMQLWTDELEEAGRQFVARLQIMVDAETGQIIDSPGLQGLLDDTAAQLQTYSSKLEALDPPPEIEDAHRAFVVVAGPRLRQWELVAERASEIDTQEELRMLTLKSAAFTETCMALERAVDAAGSQLDLDCD